MTNHLAQEKSPYLLQHAANPVDWYPWGPEALEAAKSQKKPIFLSIGYSTCHWCHVMAHESFESQETAQIMNEHFINIKVDREERPDLDHVYMTAVQLLTGAGGWPMSVWLTPDLKPFYGGTYFPREEQYGRPGFKTILREIAGVWEKEQGRIETSADQISKAVQEAIQVDSGAAESGVKSTEANREELLQKSFHHLEQSFDRNEGGFGRAPKFPMPGTLNFLLYYFKRTKNEQALKMAAFTMEKMAKGGITDQLGGGFARYSTDEKWIVPHFEKMLYDNAQLISVCLTLFQLTQHEFFKDVAKEAVGYILRDMTHKDGGFYSAEDADSEGKEGTFYLWTLAEIKQILGTEICEPFLFHFGVTLNGNFLDPHTGETGKNILVQAHSIEATAKQFGKSLEEMTFILEQGKQKLFLVRSKRTRPHLDDKVLTDWNGLMISALANAGKILKDPPILSAAIKAANFVRARLYEPASKRLFRRWRDNEMKIPAFLTDYAYLVQGLLDLYESTQNQEWLEWARDLHTEMNRNFWDDKNGGYFMSNSPDVLLKAKEEADNVTPSGNSIAALNGIRLGRLLKNEEWLQFAQKTIQAFSRPLKIHPPALLQMLIALDMLETGETC